VNSMVVIIYINRRYNAPFLSVITLASSGYGKSEAFRIFGLIADIPRQEILVEMRILFGELICGRSQ